jgi:hypothetical protein
MNKELLIDALKGARECYNKFIMSHTNYNEVKSYDEALSELIFTMFELPKVSELKDLVHKTITTDNYIKGAAERIDVVTIMQQRSRVQALAGEMRDLISGAASQVDSLVSLSNQDDYQGVRVRLDTIESMFLRHALARLETVRTLVKDM